MQSRGIYTLALSLSPYLSLTFDLCCPESVHTEIESTMNDAGK